MSGIFGIIHQDKGQEFSFPSFQDMKKMQLWNRPYGRTGEELYTGKNIALGCCLETFSVQGGQNGLAHNSSAQDTSAKDVSTHASSLILKSQNQAAVIDALLYNRQEIAHMCGLSTDLSNEELLFGYMNRLGLDSLKEVNGDFCGAVYHEQDHTLTLFRDHMGVRPLFYYSDNKLIAFSTDIHGLLALDTVDTSINETWIYRTFSGSFLDGLEATEYNHIFCVKPASYITFSFQDNGVRKETSTYWQLGSRKIHFSSFDRYKDKMKKLVTDAIKRRLDAAPGLAGAELSGGLDSGVIDILIHRLGRECLYHSWSMDPAILPLAEQDERLIIADICSQEDISCHYSGMGPGHGLDSNMAKNLQQAGIPLQEEYLPAIRYALPPYINSLTLSETAGYMKQNGANVVFTGHGGDEGVSHRCSPYELFYHREYRHFLRQLWLVTKGQKRRPIRFAKKIRKVLVKDRSLFSKPLSTVFCAPELLKSGFSDRFSPKDNPRSHFAYSPIEYINEGGSRNRLDNVALLGAYNGVRYLIPYLDYRVIDFAVSIPRHLYLKGNQNRFLFREAFKDILPDSLYHLRRKEDTSTKNYSKDPNWFEEFSRKKAYTVGKLNRTLWEPYLDFDKIDAWLKKGEPAEEEQLHDNSTLMCLFSCAMTENAVEKAKFAASKLTE